VRFDKGKIVFQNYSPLAILTSEIKLKILKTSCA